MKDLEVTDLVVALRRFTLGPVSLSVGPGQVLAVVGPNGCGKSTLLTAVLGLRRASSGRVTIRGREVDLGHPPRQVGAHLQVPGVLPWCDAVTNLRLVHGTEAVSDHDVAEVLERVGLACHRDKPVSSYSTGMQIRLGLARALLGAPRLLVLDEPTVGLDVDAVAWLVEELRTRAEAGVGILVASHDGELLEGLGGARYALDGGRPVPADL